MPRPSHSPPAHAARALPEAGRYQLREEIARGGMGVVSRVFDSYVERVVAQKRLVISEERYRARLTALFESEYDTLAQLAHPGIVEAYEYGVDAAGPYYTMELLTGDDLAKAAPLQVADACRVAREVASALALVHARRLVYRDLSPSNVKFTADGRAKLIDFGALTPFGVPREVVGTPAFMAPECLRRAPLDARTDLYALGALLYWCLTAAHAVPARGIAELPRLLGQPLRPPSERVSGIPAALDQLVLALLSNDPLARPDSAAEVMHRLTAIASLPSEEHRDRVAFSYLARPPLVGRDAQLTALFAKFDQACRGLGEALVVQGAQGLGRSALASQLVRHAQLSGASVLRAEVALQCGPFGMVRPLLRGALARLPDLAQAHPLAAQLSSQPDVPATRSAAEAAEQQTRVSASVQDCLIAFCRRAPTVLLIDDVHRADAESLGLLVALAHEARTLPLLLVATSASSEQPTHAHAHAKLVEESQVVELTALDAEHLATLTATIFAAAPNHRRLAMWLTRHGSGNPARCMTLMRGLLQRGAIEYVNGIFSLPYDVADELRAQDLELQLAVHAEQLSRSAREAAELLSIYDEDVTLEELTQSTEQSTKELVLGLEELTKFGIVRRLEGAFSFAHDSLRSALRATTAAEHQHALHLRAARALLAQPAANLDARRRASHHLLRGQARAEGLALLNDLAPALARSPEAIGTAVPALEAALALHSERGSSDYRCMPLLVPLALAGYYRDPKLLRLYIARSLDTLLQITGTTLARRLRRLLGGKLALLVGLTSACLQYLLVRRWFRIRFADVFNALFGVAGTGAAAACAAFDFSLARRMGEALSPYAAFGPRHPANIVREYCLTTAQARLGPLAPAEARFEQLMRLLADPRVVLDAEVRTQMMVGALYVSGMVKLLRANTDGLAIADQMDAQGRAFYRPHAELLRMLHYAMRGEQHLAEPHRERTELLSLLGGSGWSAVNNTAHRSIVVYQWTRDRVNLLRVIADLKRFAPLNAAVEPHLALAEAYVELMRGRAEQAVAVYEEVFARFPTPSFWTWLGERGHYAEALNSLGRYGEARAVCTAALQTLDAGEREYPFLTHVAERQLALAEAQLGDAAGAALRLENLLREVMASANPLLIGCLHRDRAQVALIARDAAAFERHLERMGFWFRASKNPALIQQLEHLSNAGAKAGLRAPWLSGSEPLADAFKQAPDNDATGDQVCTELLDDAEPKS